MATGFRIHLTPKQREELRCRARFRELCPQLLTAQTAGSGHWNMLEVPDQVNAMIERFIAISLPSAGTSG